mmetsp:Transcript_8548/g.13325  ORF Transcript_8548/g.13325 Transcript_8548/m.13325 type:complete len:342 (+) Transcript_8548:209-1234(+)
MSPASAPPADKAKLELNLVRTKKKNHDIDGVRKARGQVSNFFATLGSQVESLIDASPFGVEDPEPWTPETNPTFAALIDPITALNEICDGLPGVNGTVQVFDSEGAEGRPFAAWTLASVTLLVNVRKGLENAVEAEKMLNFDHTDTPVMVDVADADTIVPKQGGSGAFVDLGADNWGNSPRKSHPWKESVVEAKVIKKQVKKAVSNFTMNKFLPFVDNLTLRANGIIVTSDDCSVECSVASLIGTECPSIITEHDDITEIALKGFEDAVDTMKTVPEVEHNPATPEGIKIEIDRSKEEKTEDSDTTSIEDVDFVMAEDEMESSDDDDFVDVLEDFDVTSFN